MSANIMMSLSATKLEVAAGDSIETTITIRNQSQIVDHFAIKIEGLDPTWWNLSVPSVSLFPGDQDQAKLTIRPPKEAEAKAGSYPFQIKAISRANPQEMTSEEAFLILRGFVVWEVDMAPTKVVGRSGTYRLSVQNSGNTDINLTFEGKDPEEGLYYKFVRDKVTVPAGGSAQAQLSVRPKKGEPKKLYSFQVLAKPAEVKATSKEVKTLNGQLEYPRRKFPWWILILILALLIIAVAVLWFLSQQKSTPTPVKPPSTRPDVSLTIPKGGENWFGGSTKNITWTTKGSDIASVDLEYSKDNGSSWSLIAKGEKDDGTYAWKLPDTSCSNCLIRITIRSANEAVLARDTIDAAFNISAKPEVTVKAPNGGESWFAGGTQNITWTTTGTGVATVDLEYSLDKSTWVSIAKGETNDGSYSWKLPSTASNTYLIRITIRGADKAILDRDTSDKTFTITKLLLPPFKPKVIPKL